MYQLHSDWYKSDPHFASLALRCRRASSAHRVHNIRLKTTEANVAKDSNRG